MVAKLGALFHDAAFGPVTHAARLLATDQLEAGLTALRRDELMGGVRHGVERIASAAGAPALKVFRRLPMDHLEVLIENLEASQRQVSALWDAQASQAAELPAQKVTAAEVDPSKVAHELRRIAEAPDHGDELSAALNTLANQADEWVAALVECRTLLEDAPDLARAYRRRGRKRLAMAIAVTILVTGAATWLTRRHLAQARLDAQLGAGACAVESIAPADLAHASADQRAAIEGLRRQCEDGRKRERQAIESRRLADEQRRATERRKQERLEQCAQLGRHFEAGKLDDADAKIAGKHAGLLGRLLAGKLALDDVSDELGELPCADTAAVKPLRHAYARAVLDSMLAWLPSRSPSKAAQRALIEHRAELPRQGIMLFGGHIEMMAARSVATGVELRRHAALCALSATLEAKPGVNCAAVVKLAREAP
ncbi:MAG: hypothetical protein DRI90_28730 [Deltaproteobacteria bacterium]|nr:MAG: hypothetical protein DRI90_28730 [Deltaproteobacteria bacterium]